MTSNKHKRTVLDAKEEVKLNEVYFQVPATRIAKYVAGIPLFGLLFCLSMSIIYLHEKVIELDCGAINLIPSVSAITGIYPLSALWKTCVALISAPRIAVAFLYYNYYTSQAHYIKQRFRTVYGLVVKLNFLLYLADNIGLIGISYITNKDNYWLHEKIFILYMIGAIGYTLVTCYVCHWLRSNGRPATLESTKSDRIKIFATVCLVVFTLGLLYYFYWHKLHCLDGAFSRFCVCEYLIILCLLVFHYTAVYDFPRHNFILGKHHSDETRNGRKKTR